MTQQGPVTVDLVVTGVGMVTAVGFNAAETAASVRAGTVVDIKANRIYLLDIARAGDRLVAVGERGFTLVSDDAGKSWHAVGTPVVRALTGVAFSGDKVVGGPQAGRRAARP
mgnify:CR=1 FL=1